MTDERLQSVASRAWIKEVEQITLAAAQQNARVFCFTSPRADAGVSLMCRLAAASLAASQLETLLVDMSQSIDAPDHLDGVAGALTPWSPGQGDVRRSIHRVTGAYDALAAHPTPATRGRFSNVDHLRSVLNEDLASYGAIVVDLPPVLDASNDQINPIAAALACDACFMAGVMGVTTRDDAERAAHQLRAAGVNLAGVVLNDVAHESIGVALANSLGWLRWISPALHRRAEQAALASPLLN